MARKQEQPTGYVIDPKVLAKLIKQVEDELTVVWPKWKDRGPILIVDPVQKLLIKQLLYQYKYLMTQKKYIRKQDMLIASTKNRSVVVGIRKPSVRLVRPDKTKKESQ